MARVEPKQRPTGQVGNITPGRPGSSLPSLLMSIGFASLGLAALVVSIAWGSSKLRVERLSPLPPSDVEGAIHATSVEELSPSPPSNPDDSIAATRAAATGDDRETIDPSGDASKPVFRSGPTDASATGVVVNGRALSARKLRRVERAIGSKPVAGAYWYDARSGLFGLKGKPAAGILRPGMKLGRLSPRASSGNTKVYLNGRQLPAYELQLYSMLLGPIQPGRYWMDGSGNVGFQGNAAPVDNLARRWAAAVKSMKGGGGPAGKYLSGNEWSGEARIGGMPITSGTWDRSGGNNHVISVDGEVLSLPPY